MTDNLSPININSLLPAGNVHDFLVFMQNDLSGQISVDKSNYNIAIRSFLHKKDYALNYYKEFIKASHVGFPNHDELIKIIDDSLIYSDSYIDQSFHFCKDLWLFMFH